MSLQGLKNAPPFFYCVHCLFLCVLFSSPFCPTPSVPRHPGIYSAARRRPLSTKHPFPCPDCVGGYPRDDVVSFPQTPRWKILFFLLLNVAFPPGPSSPLPSYNNTSCIFSRILQDWRASWCFIFSSYVWKSLCHAQGLFMKIFFLRFF